MTERRTSRLAVAALVLGLLSIFLSAGVAAIVLGIVALHRIHRSGGQFTGKGMARTGIALALMIPLILSVLGIRSFATRMVCGANLAGIGKAMQAYAEAHDGEFPASAKWCDTLLSSTDLKPGMLECGPYRRLVKMHKYPLERYWYVRWRFGQYLQAGACDYALNPLAAGRGATGDANLVLVFESGPGWNRLGGPEAITTVHHEGDGANVLFQDMHVCFVKTQEFAKLRWKP
jgi:hypothetical protein